MSNTGNDYNNSERLPNASEISEIHLLQTTDARLQFLGTEMEVHFPLDPMLVNVNFSCCSFDIEIDRSWRAVYVYHRIMPPTFNRILLNVRMC